MPTNVVPRLREEVTIFQDRLRGVCPPELEDARRAALLDRLTRIGFELLRRGDANEARCTVHSVLPTQSPSALAQPARGLPL